MKKMISTVISILTSAAFLVPASAMSTYAEVYDIAEAGSVAAGETYLLSDLEESALTPYTGSSVLSNYSDGMHLFRDCLTDGNNLAVYSAFAELADPTTESFRVDLPETVVFELSALPTSIKYTSTDAATYSEAILSNCQPGIDALLFDMPEIFWLDEAALGISPAYSWTRSRTGTYTVSVYAITFSPKYVEAYGSLSSVVTYKAKLESAIETIAEGAAQKATRYEQLKYIHDYITDFTYYDINADFSGSAVGAIVQPGVVCEGYSKAFKLVCDYLGIPCTVVFGNFEPDTRVAHMWDYVQMEDGKWYGVDVTWDDSSSSYKYFMRGSNSFFDSHTEENTYNYSTLSYPVISRTDFDPTAPIVTTSTSTTTTETTTTTTTETTTATETETTTSATVTETTVTSTTVTETETTAETTAASSTETTVTSTDTTTTETTTTTAEPEPLDGDLNCDGEVNIADLVCCLNAVLANGPVVYDCDYNKDGVVNIFDVILMRQLIAKVVYNVDQ